MVNVRTRAVPREEGVPLLWQGHYRGSLTPFLQHRHTVPRSSEGLLSRALPCGGRSLIHSFSEVLLLKALPTSQCEPNSQDTVGSQESQLSS